MPDPFVREIGRVTDLDGIPVTVGVDYDAVTISGCKLASRQVWEFARLLIQATWEAGASLRADYPRADDGSWLPIDQAAYAEDETIRDA